ncbi:MAG: PASTA domain-containing protein [Gemmatimonadales bacterium]
MSPRSRWPQPIRWLLWLLGSIAAMAIAGYLVAALVLFPAPMLPSERTVGEVAGLMEADALRELERAGLVGAVRRQPHALVPEGQVIWQDPPPGVALPRGDSVQLIVSSGLPRVAVPDVRGYDMDVAQRLIVAAGLRVELVDTVKSTPASIAPPGVVSGTTPGAGDSVRAGGSLTMHVVQ